MSDLKHIYRIISGETADHLTEDLKFWSNENYTVVGSPYTDLDGIHYVMIEKSIKTQRDQLNRISQLLRQGNS